MKNDNRNFFSPDLELFNGGSWGGVWGGVRLILAYEAHGFTSILEKRHIFKATWGAFMGGRMEGRWNGGADGGGDFWHTWGGAGGAFQLLLKHFLTQKLRFFEMNVILIIKYWRPSMRPPIMSLVKYENMKGYHEPQSKIMFLRSLVMFTSFHRRPYEIFSIFELLEPMSWIWKFRRKAKNR